MKYSFIFLLMGWITAQSLLAQSPIQLHPQNPHYFLYQDQATVLITSAEHYGAVLNADFDYETYLHTLYEEGMNYTRIFTGTYLEVPGSFGIENNTLAPAVGSFIAPWQRVGEPGLFEGEKKFDLTQWNEIYFDRLKGFIELAEELDIIVEVTLFSSIYQDSNWERNPLNAGNNVNDLEVEFDRTQTNTLDNGKRLAFQKSLVARIVTELNSFGNVIYEIQNEPWADNRKKAMRILKTLDPKQGGWFKWAEEANAASMAWQKAMAQVIVDTEETLPYKHLIAQNYTNFKHSLPDVDPNISILNFHYVWPEAVWLNYAWDRPVGFDESGFYGDSDTTYVRQAWQFMLAGGAVFNNLDYSFFVGKEDGTGVNNAPGGGSTDLRRQLTYLRDFFDSMEFVHMQPDQGFVYQAPGMEWQGVSEPGKQYAAVLVGENQGWIKVRLVPGTYQISWISPFTGEKIQEGELRVPTAVPMQIPVPDFELMGAVRIQTGRQ